MPDMSDIAEVTRGAPPHTVVFRAWDTSNGVVGCITGGESPHVGGVVLAVPRASLTGEGVSCDCWLSPVPGHKDLDIAVPIAKLICISMGVPVTITAGIHIDGATGDDIAEISINCKAAGDAMVSLLRNNM